MATRFLETAIPMRGRMIHDISGKLESQIYDPHGQVGSSGVGHHLDTMQAFDFAIAL